MLTVKNLSLRKGHKKTPLIQDVSLEFPAGEITLLLGKSGAGKSSLLRCLAHLESSYEGEILYQGQNLKEFRAEERASRLSFIAQSYALFPHLTALINCSQPLEVVFRKTPEDAEKIALKAMASLGMESYSSSYPCELSGGQQQRIAIARALALNPNVLLLDEPSSALDPQNSHQLARILCNLAAQRKTIVIATQDMGFVSRLSVGAYLLEEGRVVVYDRYCTPPFLEKAFKHKGE